MSRSLVRLPTIALFVVLLLVPVAPAAAQRVLFDASHGETAGEADWIVDADSSEQYWDTFRCRTGRKHHSAQRFPTPPQSEIGPDTDERFWDGGISAWAIDLVKDALDPARGRSWQIEQYPWNAPPITFGDPTNPQDLANYDVLVLCEPNVLFSDAEAQAIREFVWNGGGLFLIADHETSDRNCSGGPDEVHDSPFILNRLMQTDVEVSGSPPYFDPLDPDNDFGVFGIWFHENGNDNPSDPANRAFDWFTEQANNNAGDDPADPILHGPFGDGIRADGSGGLGFFGATQMTISSHPERGNVTARGHLWRNDAERSTNLLGVSTEVTFASARYGAGRVVAVGDSSPADDGTGEGNLHPGWDRASFGVANDVIFLNATEWLADAQPDETAPVITAGPSVEPQACRAAVTWVTDEPATSVVAWGEGDVRDRQTTAGGVATGHRVDLTGLAPESAYSFQVSSTDVAGNGPTTAGPQGFTTGAALPLELLAGPSAIAGQRSIVVSWTTSRQSVATLHLRPAAGGDERIVESATAASEQSLLVEELAAGTEYLLRLTVTDDCGQTVESSEISVTTPPAPAAIDLSGWKVVSTHPQFVFTFPPGTELPAGGVLVVGRDNDRAGFEEEWGPLPAEAIYLDSGNSIVVNSTARPYRLLDADGELVDGPTAEARSSQSIVRRDACADPAAETTWSERPRQEGDPGRGLPVACGAGVFLGEVSDAGDFRNEFVEVGFDG